MWGVCISFFIPQVTHEYLGTVDPNDTILRISREVQKGNTYKTIYQYQFKYKDKNGIERDSKNIRPNVTLKDLLPGFATTSKDSWIVKQLEKGKVYAPGWKIYMIILLITSIVLLLPVFMSNLVNQIDCLKDNHIYYKCGSKDKCFACPFCVLENKEINIKLNFSKPIEKIKIFFGY